MVRKQGGFTLTELLITIVIISILLIIAVPVYFSITKSSKDNEYNSKKAYIENLAQRYAEENNISNIYINK